MKRKPAEEIVLPDELFDEHTRIMFQITALNGVQKFFAINLYPPNHIAIAKAWHALIQMLDGGGKLDEVRKIEALTIALETTLR